MESNQTTNKQKTRITGENFYKFVQCPHWLWYDLYGEQERKKTIPPIVEMIYKNGLRHEKEAIASRKFEEIRPESFQDLDEAFMATLELMRQGKNIYHGVLMTEDWAGMPDLMEARKGKSNFGDHYYVVYDIKNTREIKDESKFQLVFYSLILEKLQGFLPKEAFVINGDGQERSFLVEDFLEYFHMTRENMEKVMAGEKPAPFLKSGCKQSPWYSVCVEEAQGCNDISLIYRLSQTDQKRLYQIGIMSVKDLAEANFDDLRYKLEDWNFDKILRFHNQAQVLMSNEPMIIKKAEFPKVKTEIYFDIESDPTRNIDYLLGFLLKNENGETEYKYFLAKDKEDEAKMWADFLDFLESMEDFVIYHYSRYEREIFDKLANKYGISSELDRKFRESTIDLHRVVLESAVLPLYFYSLKDIAKYLGFKWQADDAGGAESVVWYDQWLETGDKAILDKIIRYNEDDVRATLFVKEWLEKQKPVTRREKLPEEE